MALDKQGRFLITWPGDGPTAGTYVSMQTSGPTFGAITAVKAAAATPFTAGPGVSVAGSAAAGALALFGLLLLLLAVRSRRWASTDRSGSTPSR